MKFRKLKKKSKILTKAKIIAEQVDINDKEYSSLSFEDLKQRTLFLIDGLQTNKFLLEDIIVDAFSIIREAIFRVHGLKAYNVQIMGAYVVHCGDFAEMFTGEGKTVTILIVAFLNALLKKGVHIVTVNEYLVKRDAEFSNMVLEQLGMSAGYNVSQLSKGVKQQMFARDITYTTNSELGFDYLRDNLSRSMGEKVIRGLEFVVVDEGDSVLIDEARTPLIISGMPKDDFSLYIECDKFVSSIDKNDYIIDNETNSISLSDYGVAKAEMFFNVEKLYSVLASDIVHKITNALIAHFIFANGKEYIVKDDLIYLVDQFTGRILEGRSYSAGLHQAIQAKEKVKIEPENIVMATITYQSFFRLYKKLGSVSGTAITEAEEFLKIYNMVVVQIPTNKPIIRIDKPDYIFGNKEFKWKHVIEEIVNRHKIGQPILVGTSSVSDSEIISARLNQMNINHQVLNARDNTQEAEIIKRAGQKYAITISTNMAGRGTDIKVSPEIVALGGLYVIGTERHESRRIDNQLRGRTGRQGDLGESRFFTSLEDSLFKRFATDKFDKASKKLEADFYDSKFFSKMLDRTQKKVEGLNFDIRKNLMEYDHVLSLQRELIYKQRDQILFGSNNIAIIENMGKDFVIDVVEKIRSSYNSILVDSERLVFFVNMFIFKFHFLEKDYFLNHSLTEAKDKLFAILMVVVNAKIEILTRTHGLGILGEILLSNLDHKWTSHIDKMTKLREGVSLRSLEQKMPLNIYIEDGNKLFERMKFDIVESVFTSFLKLSLPNEELEIRNALTANSINPNSFKSSSKKIDLTLTEEAKEVIDEPVIIPTPEIIIDENEIFVSQTEHTDNIVIDNNLDIVVPTEEIKAKETLNKTTKSKEIKAKETLNKTTKSKKIKTKKNI
ncbi:MAG: preprotein translocase subunit SecA [Malacoplasma sp.]